MVSLKPQKNALKGATYEIPTDTAFNLEFRLW
jgi:hypothetical protein